MANILDKAIAAISPEKGYRRAVARAALSVMNNGTGYGNYGASRISRAMRSWHVGGGSAKEDIEDGTGKGEVSWHTSIPTMTLPT